MVALYESLRDDVAAKMVADFGTTATLIRGSAESYDPTTGTNTVTEATTEIKLVMLPPDIARDEMVTKYDQRLLVSAKELNTASVVPDENDEILIGTTRMRIVENMPIQPDGVTTILYKMKVAVA
jgi:hypothetical protein